MEEEPEQIASRSDLTHRLSEILTDGSLYHRFIYTAEGLDSRDQNGHAYASLPKYIRMFCGSLACKANQLWEASETAIKFHWEMPHHVRYTCRNCSSETTHYWIKWTQGDGRTQFIKVGQWPPLSIAPPDIVAKALGKEDANLYKKALINANFSHGIAALAYLRRVIENKVNALIDLVAVAGQAAQVHADDLKEIEEIKAGKWVDAKNRICGQNSAATSASRWTQPI